MSNITQVLLLKYIVLLVQIPLQQRYLYSVTSQMRRRGKKALCVGLWYITNDYRPVLGQ